MDTRWICRHHNRRPSPSVIVIQFNSVDHWTHRERHWCRKYQFHCTCLAIGMLSKESRQQCGHIGHIRCDGQALASWINYGLGLIPGKAISWRIPLAIPLVFTSIQLATAFSFLEGPRWLVQNGRLEDATDAKAILENLHRDSEVVAV